MKIISFEVVGIIVAWSRTRIAWNPTTGKPRFFNRAEQTSWQEQIATTAVIAARQQEWQRVDEGAVLVTVEARIPMPESWSKKKQAAMDGKLMASKPDMDNIEKALFDALGTDPNGNRPRAGLYRDDAQVASKNVVKRWSTAKRAGLTVMLTTE